VENASASADSARDAREGKPMSAPTTYKIRIKGHLDPQWSAWFGGLTVTNLAHGEAELAGPLPDETALHGVLLKVRDLGLPLLSVRRVRPRKGADAAHARRRSATGGLP
jgi:hypothetical protein